MTDIWDQIKTIIKRLNHLETLENSGGGGGGHLIADEGVPLPAEPILNFTGAGVTATDNAGVSTDVDIPGASGGHVIQDEGAPLPAEPNLNFIGAGVTATDNPGATATDITIPAPTVNNTKQVVFTVFGTLIIATGGLRVYNTLNANFVIQEVEIAVSIAPVGAAILVDIHTNGVTIFTNQAHRPTIAAGAYQGTTTTIDVSAWNDGDYFTADIDAIGSGPAGSNLTVMIRAVAV